MFYKKFKGDLFGFFALFLLDFSGELYWDLWINPDLLRLSIGFAKIGPFFDRFLFISLIGVTEFLSLC